MKFTMDNTEGYTEYQLEAMNDVYFKTIKTLDKDSATYENECKLISELILDVMYRGENK